jgi:hypothetical protein
MRDSSHETSDDDDGEKIKCCWLSNGELERTERVQRVQLGLLHLLRTQGEKFNERNNAQPVAYARYKQNVQLRVG